MPQRGEALVCRAYNHFVLANIFCNAYNTHASQELGIPYMTKVETTVQPQYGRGTLQETYEKIEKDLLDGMALFPMIVILCRISFHKESCICFCCTFLSLLYEA